MSVFTPVSMTEAAAWLARYAVGELVSLEPISSGIENTNYYLTARGGQFVLTLYERIAPEELPFYLNLTAYLAEQGVAVASIERDRTGSLFSMLNGKPASLSRRLAGEPILEPDRGHCAAVGAELARLHVAGLRFRSRQSNKRGPGWMLRTSRAVRPFLTSEQNALIAEELRFQRERRRNRLPTGAIHGDLFRDNVFFLDGQLSGIIDFGFAASDELAYDLAIAVNDWCVDLESGEIEEPRMKAMLEAYTSIRPVTADEQHAWPVLLRASALRFWLSRLHDLYLPRVAEINVPHDPGHFERILRSRIARPVLWPDERL
ncbi:MAG: homoserine kinase [Casimicrobiaceae bacterium]|nr:homoserine kinase [Casimicrobiaceae bacterium]MCX8098911.1 homoserine kinase [Casimicrobiaceae bacterium]MDW8312925.1 homoserine kinase [Burkholderiales bacterium]